jgi:hypothetical protein
MKHIVRDFRMLTGKHCNSTSVRHLFVYGGFDLSEEMLFGLGSCMTFAYMDWKSMPVPFTGGRIRIGQFEENLAARLGIAVVASETTSAKKAFSSLRSSITNDEPVMIYVDMAFLEYTNFPPGAHFGGHSVVAFGFDDEAGAVYVSDRDGDGRPTGSDPRERPADYHLVPFASLEAARGSKFNPFPPGNRSVRFDFGGMKRIGVRKSAMRSGYSSNR